MTACHFPLADATARARRGVALTPLSFTRLTGFGQDNHLEAFKVFARSCKAIAASAPPLRRALAPSAALTAIAERALSLDIHDGAEAQRFFEAHFRLFRVHGDRRSGAASGFLTGYYEPIMDGSLTRTAKFTAPVLARPDDLDALSPYPDRAAIEAGVIDRHTKPLVWLRDRVDVFLVQVQGSARVRLEDGRLMRLVYAGRNGQPYTSIGRLLIESGEIDEAEMSLAALKAWVRAHGQNPGDRGFELMQRNRSYVFFTLRAESDPACGPPDGQGVSLTPLRSIAVDRAIWSYGLPFWIATDLPWQGPAASPLRRLMIAQDTGSAITGPGRVDIFFGTGDDAGARAGDIRHRADVVVLLPPGEAPDV